MVGKIQDDYGDIPQLDITPIDMSYPSDPPPVSAVLRLTDAIERYIPLAAILPKVSAVYVYYSERQLNYELEVLVWSARTIQYARSKSRGSVRLRFSYFERHIYDVLICDMVSSFVGLIL